MTAADVLALCEQHGCVMLEPREDMDVAVRGLMVTDSGMRVVYSLEALVQVFIDRDGMSRDDAVDWVSYNVDTGGHPNWPTVVSEG